MLKNRLLLSLVTGGVGFGLSLLILRDLNMAAYTGLMGFVASQAGVLVTSSQYEEHLRDRREELRDHIRALQRRRAEVYEELSVLQAEYTELSVHLQSQQAAATQGEGDVATQLNPWAPRSSSAQRVSWDLTEPRQSSIERQIDDLEQRIQILADQESDLQASIDAAINAKQKADLHRTTSEAELHQIQAQITEQEALKQTLHQTILELEQQQQQLQAEIPQLHTQIQELEEYRTTLEQTIQSGTQAGSSAGVTALQSTIEQMQSQIGALRSELEDLETQIIDRRNHKQLLDQAVDCSSTASGPTTPVVAPSPTTNAAATQLQLLEIADPTAPSITSTDRPATTPSTRIEATITTEPEVVLAAEAGQKNQKTPSRQSPPYQENGLSAEWIAFKGNLQPYEFQALCAIALEENPTSVLKQLAESNLTMPEMLIDTINEQALESIGDLILEAGHDAASTIIAQEYRDEVATLIATHR